MSISKPLYKMTIDLATYRADALKATLDRIRELVSQQTQTAAGELKTKVIVESDSEESLRQIRYQLEIYLRHNKTQVHGDVQIKEPLVRPEPEPTPMDDLLGDGVEAVTLTHNGKSATITADTARKASAMLRGSDGWASSDVAPWEA